MCIFCAETMKICAAASEYIFHVSVNVWLLLGVFQCFLKNVRLLLKDINDLIANNNIRGVILKIKNNRCEIVLILIFRSLSLERERNISILTILHLSFLISNMTLLILLFAIKLLARLSIFKHSKSFECGNHRKWLKTRKYMFASINCFVIY